MGGQGADQGSGGCLRRCLNPAGCPHARASSVVAGDARRWARHLAALLPGDPDLAAELVALLTSVPTTGDS